MIAWFLATGHKLAGIVIFATQLIVHWEDILDRFSSLFGLKKIIERRRKNMIDPLKYLSLIPALEKLVTDLTAAVNSPQDQQVLADLKALIADIKGA